MEEFVEAFVKVAGEAGVIAVAVYAALKRAWPLFVGAAAVAIYFVDEALRSV